MDDKDDRYKPILTIGVMIFALVLLLMLCWLIFRAVTGDHESFRHIGAFGWFEGVFELFGGLF